MGNMTVSWLGRGKRRLGIHLVSATLPAKSESVSSRPLWAAVIAPTIQKLCPLKSVSLRPVLSVVWLLVHFVSEVHPI